MECSLNLSIGFGEEFLRGGVARLNDTSWGDKGLSDVISAGLSEKPEKSQTPEVLENDKLLLNSLGKVKFK